MRILREEDFDDSSFSHCLGSGRFGTCYLQTLAGHYQVCVKVLKQSNNNVFIHETNILSNFTHRCLPFLFGVCVGSRPSIVTSFHGIDNRSITIYHALSRKLTELVVDWMKIFSEVISGLQHLHNKHKILHNDLKTDNIVLKSTTVPLADSTIVGAVIIDFGKACEISKGRTYNLSHAQREQYRVNHPHIAPDLRDGQCAQSVSSDVYAVGRIISIVCDRDRSLQFDTLNDLTLKCTQYHKHLRPDLTCIQTCVNDIIAKIKS